MSKEAASRAITVRVTEKEYKTLKTIAKKTGQSVSATVRNVVKYDIIQYVRKNNALRFLAEEESAGPAGMEKKKGTKCSKK